MHLYKADLVVPSRITTTATLETTEIGIPKDLKRLTTQSRDVLSRGLLENSQTEFRYDGNNVVKDVRLNPLVRNPPLFF